MTLTIPSIHYLALLPVLILFGASLALLIATALVRGRLGARVASAVTVLAAVAAFVVTFIQWSYLDAHGPSTTVANAIVLDGFSVVATAVIAISLAMAALVAHD